MNPYSNKQSANPALPTVTLLLDVGNTRIKLGWVHTPGQQRETSTLAVSHSHISEIAHWLSQQAVQPVAALGVNVAGTALAQSLDTLLHQQYGFTVDWITSQPRTAGINNAYLNPAQLGADRWLAMVGLTHYQDSSQQQPMMLASFGTATTIDTLVPGAISGDTDQPWVFMGGLILPGLELMRASLAKGTANLPTAQGLAVAFPLTTDQAISSGIAAAQVGAMQRQWQAVLTRFGLPPRIFCTGGAWPELEAEAQLLLAAAQAKQGLPACPIQWLASPVLDGLAQLTINPS